MNLLHVQVSLQSGHYLSDRKMSQLRPPLDWAQSNQNRSYNEHSIERTAHGMDPLVQRTTSKLDPLLLRTTYGLDSLVLGTTYDLDPGLQRTPL